MKHKIAITSNSIKVGMNILFELARYNEYVYLSKRDRELLLKDGTIIKVVRDIHNVRGAKYTQIITDKNPLNVFDNGVYEVMSYVKNTSPIPSEFVVIEVE